MTETKALTLYNRRNQKLAATLHGELSETMAVCCHGMLSNQHSPKQKKVAQQLSAAGIPTLRFDFAGSGDSDGLFADMTYSSRQEDLSDVMVYLFSQGAKRLALVGSSMGGAVALLAAAREERVVAIATLAAVAHTESFEERHGLACFGWRHADGITISDGFRLGKAFFEDALQHDVPSAVRVLRAPVLVIHGSHDDIVPVSDADDIATAAKNATLLLIDNADHSFSNPEHQEQIIAEVCSFFQRQLNSLQ